MTAPEFQIRFCVESDAETLSVLVHELAVFERLDSLARAVPDDFRKHLFGPHPVAEAILAEVASQAAGFALFFPTFSTFRGRPGVYLEDLYVREPYRGQGIGKALLASVARIAVDRGCDHLKWVVLGWNSSAIAFYQSIGGRPLEEWTGYRINDEPLAGLARLAPEVGTG